MKPIRTKYTNTNFVAEGCYNLPATTYIVEDEPFIETCWELTDQDIEKMKETKRIYFSCVGETIAPILLHLDSKINND